MQRFINILLGFSFIILLIIYSMPIKLNKDLIFENNIENDQFIDSVGLNSQQLLNYTKDVIVKNNLKFVSNLDDDNFILESPNPFSYQNSWSPYLEYGGKQNIKTSSILFIDSLGRYNIIYNYEFRSNNNYYSVKLGYSNKYNLQVSSKKTFLIYKDKEYEMNLAYRPLDNANTFEIPNISFSQYFKYPIVKGMYHFVFNSNEGLQSDFFQIDIDTFEEKKLNHQDNLLGFNSFRSNPNGLIKIIPSRKSIIYKEEKI